MRKIILFCIPFILIAASNLIAQGVDREELERNIKEIEFINYQGPHEIIESRSAIMSIGSSLADIISSGSTQGSASGRYRIMHLTDPSEADKKGADIFIIEPGAKVDHIRNLRLILAAYLSKMYKYNDKDAMLIAEFITYYNAVYRGNLSYFDNTYINKVMVNLSKENAGIDVNYKNWPGKTRLVIPLIGGTGGKLDLFVIADKEVVDDLRKDDEMGIDQRKKITELQEESIAGDKKVLVDKEESISKKEDLISQKESSVEQKEKELEQKRDSGSITESQAREEQKKIEDEKSAIARDRQQLDTEKQDAEAQRKEIDKKEDQIAASRESIVQDSNTVKDREANATSGDSMASKLAALKRVPFLRLDESSKDFLGRFVFYDLIEEKLLISEDAPVVGGRLYIDIPAGYVLPVKNDKTSFVLAVLSKEDLSPVLKSNEEVYSQTFLLHSDNKIYCTIKQSGKLLIGKYSHDLKLEATSDIEAFADTFITSNSNFIIFQNKGKTITIVDKETLKTIPSANAPGALLK
ncbi:MAG: hypothetical protein FWE72_09930 [Spirochaetaceae bacterium]|nr:hypothetical protein [Spirochaetaceae bacterium]